MALSRRQFVQTAGLGAGAALTANVWGRGRELGRFVVALPHDSIGTTIPQNDRLLAIVLVDQLGALLAAERDPRGNDGT